MNVEDINSLLLLSSSDLSSQIPALTSYYSALIRFDWSFGLDELPAEPGLVLIRGARQMGKSTWLMLQLERLYQAHGPGVVQYLNGDYLAGPDDLQSAIERCIGRYRDSALCYLLIDEITAIEGWEKVMKRCYDSGLTRKLLIVTTGSKAIDLRRGTERLPGRKGKLDRTNYFFTHIPYPEFAKKGRQTWGEDTLWAYLLTGGSPLAANELARLGYIPEYVFTLTRDWVLGECASQDRSRQTLLWLTQGLIDRGGSVVSLTRMAREIGVANNTVLQGYIELLCDLLCISNSYAVELHTKKPMPRKEHKFHWIHLLAANSFNRDRKDTLETFKNQDSKTLAKWWEWAVAQEVWRRNAVRGNESPEVQYFYRSGDREIDFWVPSRFGSKEGAWVEAKYGKAHSFEFDWLLKAQGQNSEPVTVICAQGERSSSRLIFQSLEEFLLINK